MGPRALAGPPADGVGRVPEAATDGLLGRWLRWVTAGELLGFLVPSLVVPLVLDSAAPVVLAAAVVAGLGEGTVLGLAQARVLRGVLPALSGRRWVVGTALAAALAWVVGMLPSTLYDTWSTWPVGVAIALGLPLALVLLTSIGVAQWYELRRHVARAGAWVAATALAWGVGLTAFGLVTTPLWQPGQGTALVLAIGLLGGLTMAAAMALTTGLALRRLLSEPRDR
ncbi:hypothetical protein [Cellulomonas sp. KRMCY2]|uniref:hypothetical protein n=1 Tax=Cellulomonas sp. KRMCY2 TaxID=1304865 RepID=UPI001E3A2887|nr:hypothetical protein [Cellulomonas sp. KRMCY2]